MYILSMSVTIMQGQLHFGNYMKCYFDFSEEIKKQANRARICTIYRGLGINSGLPWLAESIPGLFKIRVLVVGEYLNRRQRPGDFHESFGKKTCDLMYSCGFPTASLVRLLQGGTYRRTPFLSKSSFCVSQVIANVCPSFKPNCITSRYIKRRRSKRLQRNTPPSCWYGLRFFQCMRIRAIKVKIFRVPPSE
jgi:hypothetical protein